MAFFQDLGAKKNKIIQLLLASQNLCKLLYYNTTNPLNESTISDTSVLLFDKLFPMMKYPDAETEKSSRLCVYFRDIIPFKTNEGFREPKLCFDIICHQNVWLVNSNERPFLIMEEIDKIFNDQYIPEISTREVGYSFADIRNYADYFDGYYLMYNLTESSYLGCVN